MKNTTIHIFGYGEAQIISDEVNFKASVSDFKTLDAVIADVKSKRPKALPDKPYHVINIFSDKGISYLAKRKDTDNDDGSFAIESSSALDSQKLSALISEFKTLKSEFDKAEKEKENK